MKLIDDQKERRAHLFNELGLTDAMKTYHLSKAIGNMNFDEAVLDVIRTVRWLDGHEIKNAVRSRLGKNQEFDLPFTQFMLQNLQRLYEERKDLNRSDDVVAERNAKIRLDLKKRTYRHDHRVWYGELTTLMNQIFTHEYTDMCVGNGEFTQGMFYKDTMIIPRSLAFYSIMVDNAGDVTYSMFREMQGYYKYVNLSGRTLFPITFPDMRKKEKACWIQCLDKKKNIVKRLIIQTGVFNGNPEYVVCSDEKTAQHWLREHTEVTPNDV
jgi:hypothetical protein